MTAAAGLAGIPLMLSPDLPDGTLVDIGGQVMLGTRPLTELEQAGRDARRIVREGLADVLTWCGLPVDLEPGAGEVLVTMRADLGDLAVARICADCGRPSRFTLLELQRMSYVVRCQVCGGDAWLADVEDTLARWRARRPRS